MKVLVCGGRDYNDGERLFAYLDKLDKELPEPGITGIVSGCARGADTLAIQWSRKWDLPVSFFPADWNKHGRSAGHIRNQQMLDQGKPDLVVAFPGGRGTANMIERAKTAGVPVREVQ